MPEDLNLSKHDQDDKEEFIQFELNDSDKIFQQKEDEMPQQQEPEEDQMQLAAQEFILPLKFLNYDMEQNNAVVSGDIHMIHFSEDDCEPSFEQNWICIHEDTIRVYRKRIDFLNEASSQFL